MPPCMNKELTGPMPGKCKFYDSWLSFDPYKNWFLKVPADVHLARCTICKNVKLDTMGESALKSHVISYWAELYIWAVTLSVSESNILINKNKNEHHINKAYYV